MLDAQASQTALRVALRRAAHQLYDSPAVFEDPYAVRILAAEHLQWLGRTPLRKDRPYSAALRAFLVARSRYAEDALAQAVAGGVRQYLLLGAGLDTFALRNPYPHLRVFEVDHPATQAWKLHLLAQRGISLPDAARLVPVNFESESLASCLHAAGCDLAAPVFVSWLGVIPYLTLAAFRTTVASLSLLPPGSAVALDYSLPRHLLPTEEQLQHDSLAARVQQAGEPFQLFFTPDEMAAELRAFPRQEHLGRDEINARYFTVDSQPRPDGLQVRGEAGRFATAWR